MSGTQPRINACDSLIPHPMPAGERQKRVRLQTASDRYLLLMRMPLSFAAAGSPYSSKSRWRIPIE
eukprot:6192037-Pleurochrysis_carterae.AAC.2